MGAIGAALLAREKMSATEAPSRFRGWDLEQVDYTIREFTCKGCTNECDIRQFTIGDEKTYWGDKCSDRYRKRAKVDKEPVIRDLVEFRERSLLLLRAPRPRTPPALLRSGTGAPRGTIGIPRAMYTYDRLPFWATFFKALRLRRHAVPRRPTRTSARWASNARWPSPASPSGWPTATWPSCWKPGVDHIFLPNQLNEETDHPEHRVARLPLGPDPPPRHPAGPAVRGARGPVPRPHHPLPPRARVRAATPCATALKPLGVPAPSGGRRPSRRPTRPRPSSAPA